MALRYEKGSLFAYARTGASESSKKKGLVAAVDNQKHHIKIKFKRSLTNGYMRVFFDGVEKFSHQGRTTQGTSNDNPMAKVGVYNGASGVDKAAVFIGLWDNLIIRRGPLPGT